MLTMDNAEANVHKHKSHKGIYGTAIVQCAAACKWLQSGSGLVDAGWLTHASTSPETSLSLSNRHVANYRAHREMCMRDRPVRSL